MSKNIILIIAIGILAVAIYLNYFYFVRDSHGFGRKHFKKKNKTKLEYMTKKIDDNVQINEYKNLFEDYRKLQKEIATFEETNGYIMNEIKSINLVEKMKAAKNKYMALKLNEADREYISDFSEDQINRIKELINS